MCRSCAGARTVWPVRAAAWEKDVAEILLFMPDMAFFFEHAEFCANGGVGWSVRDRFVNFRGGGAAPLIEDIHDLALTAAEGDVSLFSHSLSCCKSSIMLEK